MKNTLLALMLVSSLFVISCGADSTKPADAYKSQKTEISSGTKTTNNINITATSQTVDVSSFALPGEKVTEIVEATVDNAVVKTPTSAKNPDGGIYKFTTTGNTGNVTSVTYKYTKTAIAPIITKTLYTSTDYSGNLTINDVDFNDKSKLFEKQILSITDTYGNDIVYTFDSKMNTITLNGVTRNTSLTIKYQYMDINLISEKPTKEGAIEAQNIITLTAATDSGKTYICKYNNTYKYGIVPADGIIPSSSLSGATQNDNYKLWLY